MSTLLERAAAIRARNAVLESVPGSGYHSSDVDHWGRLRAPQCRHLSNGQEPGAHPLPPVSEHIVPFFDERRVIFAGECAAIALAALQIYSTKNRARLQGMLDGGDPDQLTGTEYKMVREVPRLAIVDDELVIWLDQWNDVLFALYEQGIGLTGAPYDVD